MVLGSETYFLDPPQWLSLGRLLVADASTCWVCLPRQGVNVFLPWPGVRTPLPAAF